MTEERDPGSPGEGRTVDPVDPVALLRNCDHEVFYRSAAGLARAGHGSLLQPMDFDPALAFHRADCVVWDAAPADRDTMHLYGRAACPAFDEVEAAFSDPALDHLLNDLRHRLDDGGNVALVTNHGEIIDIAIVLAGLVLALSDPGRSYGVLGEHQDLAAQVRRSNLILSKMVATRQAFGLPVPEVLGVLCRSWFSLPQTATRRRSRLDPELARAANRTMRTRLHAELARGGQLLAMAASGSQDLSLAADLAQRVRASWRRRRGEEPQPQASLHLQPLYAGTIDLMTTCRTVLPVSVSLKPGATRCVVGALTTVRTEDDCHGVMEWIAREHERATGVRTVYHRREDDLLSQVRSSIASRSARHGPESAAGAGGERVSDQL